MLKKFLFLLMAVCVGFSALATTDIQPNGNLSGGNTAANCTQPVLGTYSGSTNFEAKWRANTVPLKWYNQGTQLSVDSAANTCTYDGVLNIPTTPPNRIGYVFDGWKIKKIFVPDGYTQLEYLESNGTQYIDTGLSNTNGWAIETDFIPTTENGGFGVGRNGNSNECFFAFNYSPNYKHLRVFNNGHEYTGIIRPAVTGQRYRLYAELFTTSTKVILDNETILNTSSSGNRLTDNVLLFKVRISDTYGSSKIFYAKFYNQSGELVRDFVPAKNSSNVLGMYDTVSGTFFTNAGSGTFTAGPEVSN